MSAGAILILGCGYAGCELAQRVGFQGRAVFGTTRSDQRSMVIRSRGAEPLIMDTSDLSSLARLRGRVDAVVDLIPPTVQRDGSWEDPTLRIMDHISGWGLRAFVYVSSTSVYGDHDGVGFRDIEDVFVVKKDFHAMRSSSSCISV